MTSGTFMRDIWRKRRAPFPGAVAVGFLFLVALGCNSEPTYTEIGAWILIEQPDRVSNATIYIIQNPALSHPPESIYLSVTCQEDIGLFRAIEVRLDPKWLRTNPNLRFEDLKFEDLELVGLNSLGKGGYRIDDRSGEFLLSVPARIDRHPDVRLSILDDDDDLYGGSWAVENKMWKDMFVNSGETLFLSIYRNDGSMYDVQFAMDGLHRVLQGIPCVR